MSKRANPVSRQAGWWVEFFRSIRLAWRLVWDSRVPLTTKAVIPALVLLYVFSPIDLAPDVLPLLGQIDDLAILLLGSRLFISLCPPYLVRQHEQAMDGNPTRADGKDENGTVVETTFRVVEDEKP